MIWVDRGYRCLPEIDLGLPFPPGMNALLTTKLPKGTAHEAMTTGRRYAALEAVAAGILDATAVEDAVVSTAVEPAAGLARTAIPMLGEIKTRLYADAVAALTAVTRPDGSHREERLRPDLDDQVGLFHEVPDLADLPAWDVRADPLRCGDRRPRGRADRIDR